MNDLMPGLAAVEHLHPLTVHFPIAIWPVALLLLAVSVARPGSQLRTSARWLVHLGTISGIIAAGFGWWAADQLGHDSAGHDGVHDHRSFMLGAVALSVVASAAAEWDRRHTKRGWLAVLLGALALTVGLSVVGADRGALLVYGYGVGTNVEPTMPHGEAPHAAEPAPEDASAAPEPEANEVGTPPTEAPNEAPGEEPSDTPVEPSHAAGHHGH